MFFQLRLGHLRQIVFKNLETLSKAPEKTCSSDPQICPEITTKIEIKEGKTLHIFFKSNYPQEN